MGESGCGKTTTGKAIAQLLRRALQAVAAGAYDFYQKPIDADVLRLIKEAPDAVGLAVPGMPVGSPGMDGPDYGDQRDPFDVLLVAKDGSTRVFSSYR